VGLLRPGVDRLAAWWPGRVVPERLAVRQGHGVVAAGGAAAPWRGRGCGLARWRTWREGEPAMGGRRLRERDRRSHGWGGLGRRDCWRRGEQGEREGWSWEAGGWEPTGGGRPTAGGPAAAVGEEEAPGGCG
jgi:hypothetical protein